MTSDTFPKKPQTSPQTNTTPECSMSEKKWLHIPLFRGKKPKFNVDKLNSVVKSLCWRNKFNHVCVVQKEKKQSLYLNGTSSYQSIPDTHDWNFGDEDFTVEYWVKFNTRIRDWSYAAKWNLAQQLFSSPQFYGTITDFRISHVARYK